MQVAWTAMACAMLASANLDAQALVLWTLHDAFNEQTVATLAHNRGVLAHGGMLTALAARMQQHLLDSGADGLTIVRDGLLCIRTICGGAGDASEMPIVHFT